MLLCSRCIEFDAREFAGDFPFAQLETYWTRWGGRPVAFDIGEALVHIPPLLHLGKENPPQAFRVYGCYPQGS